jgi:Protein of unknown function (DUF732)
VLSKLADNSIPTSDFVHGSIGAVGVRRAVCDLMAKGHTISELVETMRTDTQDMTLTTDQANLTVHTAIDVYCPTAGH